MPSWLIILLVLLAMAALVFGTYLAVRWWDRRHVERVIEAEVKEWDQAEAQRVRSRVERQSQKQSLEEARKEFGGGGEG